MANTNDLHTAIIKGQLALVKKLADELCSQGIDISQEVQFAKLKAKINRGTYQTIFDVLSKYE